MYKCLYKKLTEINVSGGIVNKIFRIALNCMIPYLKGKGK
jgi:hypothetical protein